MLDIKLIRQNPEKIKEALEKRPVKVEVDKILELDIRRRSLTAELDESRAEQNRRSKGGPKKAAELEELKKLKEKVKGLEEELKNVEQEFESAMYTLPNIPFDEVPMGRDEKIIKF
ncbi:MAG: hypothetical protein A3I92_00235 [Candidatus Yanofskybacteria bacterium RIFCSPLOWO2_02_FULL_43_10b]|uniref:Serine-tRNA synthetase type1 N-terminal domain-containing protein n=1 Tax=Candidatus Yanofskybacteria bacterium RIFCSPLOWO2_02_FULL_43_10b TaxID=1802704 RepID=A0A1F8H725_9BACT|nr:MAG: hypothetical protein A3I92_00235 [Candidatus Yanofskybacteria bacterium RIFCSPLOWO2_02_FULL_43_10b]